MLCFVRTTCPYDLNILFFILFKIVLFALSLVTPFFSFSGLEILAGVLRKSVYLIRSCLTCNPVYKLYIYIYIYIYSHAYICVYIYININTNIHIHIHTHTHTHHGVVLQKHLSSTESSSYSHSLSDRGMNRFYLFNLFKSLDA
jgi:hypothetical protein